MESINSSSSNDIYRSGLFDNDSTIRAEIEIVRSGARARDMLGQRIRRELAIGHPRSWPAGRTWTWAGQFKGLQKASE